MPGQEAAVRHSAQLRSELVTALTNSRNPLLSCVSHLCMSTEKQCLSYPPEINTELRSRIYWTNVSIDAKVPVNIICTGPVSLEQARKARCRFADYNREIPSIPSLIDASANAINRCEGIGRYLRPIDWAAPSMAQSKRKTAGIYRSPNDRDKRRGKYGSRRSLSRTNSPRIAADRWNHQCGRRFVAFPFRGANDAGFHLTMRRRESRAHRQPGGDR